MWPIADALPLQCSALPCLFGWLLFLVSPFHYHYNVCLRGWQQQQQQQQRLQRRSHCCLVFVENEASISTANISRYLCWVLRALLKLAHSKSCPSRANRRTNFILTLGETTTMAAIAIRSRNKCWAQINGSKLTKRVAIYNQVIDLNLSKQC